MLAHVPFSPTRAPRRGEGKYSAYTIQVCSAGKGPAFCSAMRTRARERYVEIIVRSRHTSFFFCVHTQRDARENSIDCSHVTSRKIGLGLSFSTPDKIYNIYKWVLRDRCRSTPRALHKRVMTELSCAVSLSASCNSWGNDSVSKIRFRFIAAALCL